jgi:hypothetical protein
MHPPAGDVAATGSSTVRALKPLRPALPRQLRATPPLRAKQPTKLLYRHHLASSIFHASRLSLYIRLSKLDNHFPVFVFLPRHKSWHSTVIPAAWPRTSAPGPDPLVAETARRGGDKVGWVSAHGFAVSLRCIAHRGWKKDGYEESGTHVSRSCCDVVGCGAGACADGPHGLAGEPHRHTGAGRRGGRAAFQPPRAPALAPQPQIAPKPLGCHSAAQRRNLLLRPAGPSHLVSEIGRDFSPGTTGAESMQTRGLSPGPSPPPNQRPSSPLTERARRRRSLKFLGSLKSSETLSCARFHISSKLNDIP